MIINIERLQVNMNIIEEIKTIVKKEMEDSKGSHDWDHTLRVHNLCMHISNIEKADREILEIAAYLHDIGRKHQDTSNGKLCHAEHGAELAKNILKTLQYDESKIDRVVHCIRTHRFRNEHVPESMEAKILFDADKLDAIGAVGIGRAFLFSGEVGAKLHNDKNTDIKKTGEYSQEDTAYREYMVKLRYVKDKMLTDEGKRLAEERDRFMKTFFERLQKEIDGDV